MLKVKRCLSKAENCQSYNDAYFSMDATKTLESKSLFDLTWDFCLRQICIKILLAVNPVFLKPKERYFAR
jgi:hypothetical protein